MDVTAAKYIGVLFGNYLQAAMRNPAAAASERVYLFLGMALAESMGIFGLVMGFVILFVKV
jgi:F-type H+-transporting ATPase subunit c